MNQEEAEEEGVKNPPKVGYPSGFLKRDNCFDNHDRSSSMTSEENVLLIIQRR
jgi:hypothetical protein